MAQRAGDFRLRFGNPEDQKKVTGQLFSQRVPRLGRRMGVGRSERRKKLDLRWIFWGAGAGRGKGAPGESRGWVGDWSLTNVGGEGAGD